MALGIAVGRLGAFLDGHGQGVPSDLPWATQYANPLAATPDFGVPRHPAQLYDALVALALFVARSAALPAAAAGRQPRWPLFWCCTARPGWLLGAVRLDPPFLFGLQIEQLLALGGDRVRRCGTGCGRWSSRRLARRARRRASRGATRRSRGGLVAA